jgi:hypothetical protein
MRTVTRSWAPLVLSVLLFGCAGLLPQEERGGLDPRPSKVSDLGFMAIGAGIDVAWEYTGQKLLRLVPLVKKIDPNVIRIGVVDLGSDYCARACAAFHRPVDSGFLMGYGQGIANMARFVLYHVKHPSHPSCVVSRGPDTTVTVPMAVQPIKGWMWGGECLTWEQIRQVRGGWR